MVTNTSTLTKRGRNATSERHANLRQKYKHGEKKQIRHHFVLSEEADALPDSAADEVGGVTEEDGAIVLAGAAGGMSHHAFTVCTQSFLALLDL